MQLANISRRKHLQFPWLKCSNYTCSQPIKAQNFFFFQFFQPKLSNYNVAGRYFKYPRFEKRISTITQNSFKLGKKKISNNFILQYQWTQEKKCEKAESELLLILISSMYKLLSVHQHILQKIITKTTRYMVYVHTHESKFKHLLS